MCADMAAKCGYLTASLVKKYLMKEEFLASRLSISSVWFFFALIFTFVILLMSSSGE